MKTIKELEDEIANPSTFMYVRVAQEYRLQALKDVLGLNKQFFQEQRNYFKKPGTALNKAMIELINAWEEELKKRIEG